MTRPRLKTTPLRIRLPCPSFFAEPTQSMQVLALEDQRKAAEPILQQRKSEVNALAE